MKNFKISIGVVVGIIAFLIISVGVYKFYVKRTIENKQVELPLISLPTDIKSAPKNPFVTLGKFDEVKEYTYVVKYMGMDAGIVQVKFEPNIQEGNLKIVKLTANVETAKSLAAAYSLKATLVSKVSQEHLLPLEADLNQTDSFSKIKRRTSFDYANKKIHYIEKGFRMHRGDYERVLDLPMDTLWFDELSSALLLRFVTLSEHTTFEVPIVSNRKFYKIRLFLNEKQNLYVENFGNLEVIEATVNIIQDSEILSIGKNVIFYIAPSLGNIPVLMKGKLETHKFKLGEVTITLVKGN